MEDVEVVGVCASLGEYAKTKAVSERKVWRTQCVKSVCIRSFSGPYFPAFGLNIERYGVYFRIQPECGKIRTRKTPNTDFFHAVTQKVCLGKTKASESTTDNEFGNIFAELCLSHDEKFKSLKYLGMSTETRQVPILYSF